MYDLYTEEMEKDNKSNFIMDTKGKLFQRVMLTIIGGGLQHYELGNQKYMRLAFGEGLRVPKQ